MCSLKRVDKHIWKQKSTTRLDGIHRVLERSYKHNENEGHKVNFTWMWCLDRLQSERKSINLYLHATQRLYTITWSTPCSDLLRTKCSFCDSTYSLLSDLTFSFKLCQVVEVVVNLPLLHIWVNKWLEV